MRTQLLSYLIILAIVISATGFIISFTYDDIKKVAAIEGTSFSPIFEEFSMFFIQVFSFQVHLIS